MSDQVSRQELAEIIGEKTLHITDKSKLVKSIAAYLVEKNEKVDLSSLTRDVMQYRLNRGIVEAVVVSAHELPPHVIKDIEELLKEHFPKAKSIYLDYRIDTSLVGGIRIELPQETLDISVRARLNLFKRLVAQERN